MIRHLQPVLFTLWCMAAGLCTGGVAWSQDELKVQLDERRAEAVQAFNQVMLRQAAVVEKVRLEMDSGGTKASLMKLLRDCQFDPNNAVGYLAVMSSNGYSLASSSLKAKHMASSQDKLWKHSALLPRIYERNNSDEYLYPNFKVKDSYFRLFDLKGQGEYKNSHLFMEVFSTETLKRVSSVIKLKPNEGLYLYSPEKLSVFGSTYAGGKSPYSLSTTMEGGMYSNMNASAKGELFYRDFCREQPELVDMHMLWHQVYKVGSSALRLVYECKLPVNKPKEHPMIGSWTTPADAKSKLRVGMLQEASRVYLQASGQPGVFSADGRLFRGVLHLEPHPTKKRNADEVSIVDISGSYKEELDQMVLNVKWLKGTKFLSNSYTLKRITTPTGLQPSKIPLEFAPAAPPKTP